MSSKRTAFNAFRAFVMLAMAAVVIPGAALAQERGRSIEFSAPKSDELSTNLHQLTSKKDSLKQLE